MKLVLIGIGGAIGAVLRYVVSGLDYRYSNGVFPFSTLVVNLSGSFAIGFLWGLFDEIAVSPNIRMFILIGIIGGFTTFSTFALENFNLLRDGEHGTALLNILLSNLFGVLLVFAGYAVIKTLIHIVK
ncbi:MAG: fluoride efflux transporter CrcB [Candidatus Omnitrophica bacterium]|nr:fluoride efflux transporter CrcB [Candidatus Omnitrophota bacterium]